jgi:hypothetical protein
MKEPHGQSVVNRWHMHGQVLPLQVHTHGNIMILVYESKPGDCKGDLCKQDGKRWVCRCGLALPRSWKGELRA